MADTPHPDAWRRTLRARLMVLVGILLCWTAVIQARLIWLQAVKHTEYVARAERQQMRTLTVPAKRGEVYDRHGRVLATSVDVDTVYAVPSEIERPAEAVAALCGALTGCTGDFRQMLVERLSQDRAFGYVKRRVSAAEADAVMALELDGIGLSEESRRFYPNRSLLASTLGFVGVDSEGLGGIEASWNDVVRGKDGKTIVFTDARRHAYARVERPATAGASLELTIDTVLQHIVERELRSGIAENRAEAGVAIVMDPWTGEILALASEPTFNPNTFRRATGNEMRNRAVQDIYEPGSTFKMITAAAALEEGVIRPDSMINCAPGYIDIAGWRRVHDEHAYGQLSFEDVIVKSSNVGAIKTGFRLGAERMSRYLRRFGFGSRLSRDLPGEEPGIVWSQLNDSALASVSMGYQIGVTPLQMISAVSTVANGGRLFRPRVVRAVLRDGRREPIEPEVLRRVVQPETTATLTSIMEGVVERGTARAAQIDGYRIAGKTGTAAKLVNGAYSKSEYMASFIGFLPSRAPRVAILVVIDTPRKGTYFGGTVAAPVFKRIAEGAVRYLGIRRSIDPPPTVLAARAPRPSIQQARFGPESVLPALAATGRNGVMPDLRGLGARAAVRTLAQAGLVPVMTGSGQVVEQEPEAGAPLEGQRVRLRLARLPGPDAFAAAQASPVAP